MIYTGIGSRETPSNILLLMYKMGMLLAEEGFILRSGGVNGADAAFEKGCDDYCLSNGIVSRKQIFLPWKKFNKNLSSYFDVSEEALELAKKYHPAWDACSYVARKLHGRNGYQVLGYDLKTPTDIVICYAPGGLKGGGTSQALRIATDHKIPIINLYDNEYACLTDKQLFQIVMDTVYK